jgi:formylglycine-generating enzyme required for sulfatase activity
MHEDRSRHTQNLRLVVAIPLLLAALSTAIAYLARLQSGRGTAAAPASASAPFSAATARKHQEQWSHYLHEDRIQSNSVGISMVLIPPGNFLMGSTEAQQHLTLQQTTEEDGWWTRFLPSETPQHRVFITRPYRISTHPITVAQFRVFVDETGYQTVAETDGKGGIGRTDGVAFQKTDWTWRHPSFEVDEDHPVTQVTWKDAVAFCEWLAKREGTPYHLPSEAQWEFACRAGSETIWCFGDDVSQLRDYAWHLQEGGYSTKPVGRKAPNGFGLFDMHGHVWEWCADHWEVDFYRQSPIEDPLCQSGPTRTLRSGSFSDNPGTSRSAMRGGYPIDYRWDTVGFRVAAQLPRGS